MNYLLDTNILVVYVRGNKLMDKIEQELKLFTSDHQLVISTVSVGEIRSLAIKNSWGRQKTERLDSLLKRLAVANINVDEVILRYAEIDAYSQGRLSGKPVNFSARNMGKNDLWIAAIGSVLKLVLITTDGDFDHLQGEYLDIKKVDLRRYLNS